MKKSAKPVEAALPPITTAIDTPPAQPLSAFMEGRPISVEDGSFDKSAARRLQAITEKLLPAY